MSPEIIDKPAFTVTGMSILTTPLSPEIPALWPRFAAREAEIAGRTEPGATYGVMRHEPPDQLLYMACVAVAPSAHRPAGMVTCDVPSGRYARFRYPLERLGEGFCEIFDRVLPASDYVQGPGFLLERYDEAFDPADPSSLVEILVPVRARDAVKPAAP